MPFLNDNKNQPIINRLESTRKSSLGSAGKNPDKSFFKGRSQVSRWEVKRSLEKNKEVRSELAKELKLKIYSPQMDEQVKKMQEKIPQRFGAFIDKAEAKRLLYENYWREKHDVIEKQKDGLTTQELKEINRDKKAGKFLEKKFEYRPKKEISELPRIKQVELHQEKKVLEPITDRVIRKKTEKPVESLSDDFPLPTPIFKNIIEREKNTQPVEQEKNETVRVFKTETTELPKPKENEKIIENVVNEPVIIDQALQSSQNESILEIASEPLAQPLATVQTPKEDILPKSFNELPIYESEIKPELKKEVIVPKKSFVEKYFYSVKQFFIKKPIINEVEIKELKKEKPKENSTTSTINKEPIIDKIEDKIEKKEDFKIKEAKEVPVEMHKNEGSLQSKIPKEQILNVEPLNKTSDEMSSSINKESDVDRTLFIAKDSEHINASKRAYVRTSQATQGLVPPTTKEESFSGPHVLDKKIKTPLKKARKKPKIFDFKREFQQKWQIDDLLSKAREYDLLHPPLKSGALSPEEVRQFEIIELNKLFPRTFGGLADKIQLNKQIEELSWKIKNMENNPKNWEKMTIEKNKLHFLEDLGA